MPHDILTVALLADLDFSVDDDENRLDRSPWRTMTWPGSSLSWASWVLMPAGIVEVSGEAW
jgi:hypothetical protein